jgi:cobalt-zinc-cadmium efflux system membrane fusion protein
MTLRYLTVALALVTAGCSSHAAAPAPPAQAPSRGVEQVVVPQDSPMRAHLKRAVVSEMDLPTDEVVAPGKIEANPNRISKIVLPVAGRIGEVRVKAGDTVRAGQPLLAIQSSDADAAMSAYLSAEAGVTQARTAAVKAQADYDRASDLFEHDAVARKEVLADESALTQAKAATEQAGAVREQSLRRLSVLGLEPGHFDQQVVVRSPLAGKVLELSVVSGEFRNDTTAPVITIADLSTVWVTSQVPESYIRYVQLGERLEIALVAYPGETFVGTVSRIADTVDAQSRTVKVQAELDNHDGRLRPEMYGSIHHIESTERVPTVAASAIVQSGARTIVFVESPAGGFEAREVTVGKRAGDVVRVLKGLKVGESVVVDGAMLLEGLSRS